MRVTGSILSSADTMLMSCAVLRDAPAKLRLVCVQSCIAPSHAVAPVDGCGLQQATVCEEPAVVSSQLHMVIKVSIRINRSLVGACKPSGQNF